MLNYNGNFSKMCVLIYTTKNVQNTQKQYFNIAGLIKQIDITLRRAENYAIDGDLITLKISMI